MIKIQIEIDENSLRQLAIDYLSKQVGFELTEQDVLIQVKSKQNYRSEWETAAFRAQVLKTIL